MDEDNGCIFSKTSSCLYVNVTVALTIITILFVVRVLYVLYWTGNLFPRDACILCALVVLGGHTTEMLNLLLALKKGRFAPRFYGAAATDNMSLQKASALENSLNDIDMTAKEPVAAHYLKICRSREVGQSYITSIWTTLIAVANALWIMIRIRAQVLLCNGPGTCIPLCIIAFFIKVVGIRWSYIFYIESIARVRRLSLSGLILYKLGVADELFVQWPQLHENYMQSNYVVRLMW